MKRANIGAVLNCDLEKVGQIKNPGIMSCTYDNLEMIQPLVQE
jgi:hypothetical protein